MNKTNIIREYWIFIDDSGNIELSSDNKYFIYGALIFNNYQDVENFRIQHKNTLLKLFNNSKEIKATWNMSNWKREEIYNVITNTNCQLISVIEQKNLSNSLTKIEKNYQKSLRLLKNQPLKSKLAVKKRRVDDYAYHKTYLIGQLICLIVENIKKRKNMKINIILDQENLGIAGNNFDDFIDYLKYEQKYLKLRSYSYTFEMKNSKNEYCLQGADFFAHAIYRYYNKKDSKKIDYINQKKKIITKTFPYILNKETTKEKQNNIIKEIQEMEVSIENEYER